MKYIKYVYSYSWKYKQFFIPSIIFNVVVSFLYNLQPLYFKNITNAALAGNSQEMSRLLMWVIIIIIVSFVGDIITNHLGDKSLALTSAHIKQDVFKHVHQLDFNYHSQKFSGQLISIFKR